MRLAQAWQPAVLFLCAFGLRAWLLGAPPYGDEAAHYTMARTLGFLDARIHWIGPEAPFQLYPLVLGRPIFALAHAPAAWFGFDAFRLLGIVFASCVPVLAWALVRQGHAGHGAGSWAAFAAGAFLALEPKMLVWGARIFPDSLMAALVLLGLHLWRRGSIRWACVALVAAAWTKEVAIAAIAGLALLVASEMRANGRAWLQQRLIPLGIATGASVAPLVAGYVAYPRLPGWSQGASLGATLDGLLPASPALLVLVPAWRRPQQRPVAAVLVAVLTLHLLFALRGGGVNAWYAILPTSLVVVLVAEYLAEAASARVAPRAAGVAAFVVAAFVLLGSGQALAAVLHPFDPSAQHGTAASVGQALREQPELAAAIAFHEGRSPATVLELDVGWFWIDHPLGGDDATTLWYTTWADGRGEDPPLERLAAVGEASDLVWVQQWDTPLIRAWQATYADCLVFDAFPLAAYDLDHCIGQAQPLRHAYEAAATAGARRARSP